MSTAEEELRLRLAALPDADSDFIWCTEQWIVNRGLIDEVLQLLNENPQATTETIITFDEVYCGDIEVYGDDGSRIPVDPKRLAFTSGMRDILAEAKGKTFKSCVFEPKEEGLADCNVRVNFGQHAVDLNCYDFAFDIGGKAVGLGAWHCERMSLMDDFRSWSDEPFRTQLVGERITGVELVTDHVTFEDESQLVEVDIDVAVVLRTAHAAYTFARESWDSTGIWISAAEDIVLASSANERNIAWLNAHQDLGTAKVTCSTTWLA